MNNQSLVELENAFIELKAKQKKSSPCKLAMIKLITSAIDNGDNFVDVSAEALGVQEYNANSLVLVLKELGIYSKENVAWQKNVDNKGERNKHTVRAIVKL